LKVVLLAAAVVVAAVSNSCIQVQYLVLC